MFNRVVWAAYIASAVTAAISIPVPAEAQRQAQPQGEPEAERQAANVAVDQDALLDRIAGEVQRAEDVSAIKRLQRTYGYYLDKGLWSDLAEFFTDDAVANYPAGVFIGKESIRRHLFLNVGGVEMNENGLGDLRIYDHINMQPVVHLDRGGNSAHGRWRAVAMFGRFGGGATWADGIYEITYAKVGDVWKIQTLDYHSGFSAPFSTGWVNPGDAPRRSGLRNLTHAPDRARNMPCEGFPEACLAPFHYDNPGTTDGAHVWPLNEPGIRGRGNRDARAIDLLRRSTRLKDGLDLENLQRIYGYYIDRGLWDQAAALFADEGTIELELQGVYVGPSRIEAFLSTLGPYGGRDGLLSDHVQLQPVVTVDDDGSTAKSRSRELAMTGVFEGDGEWRTGIYENTYIKQDGVWKIQSLRFFPTFVTDYDAGWAEDAQPPRQVNADLPPDRPPTELYETYPKAHVPPYHYANPVTDRAATYPREAGRPSRDEIRWATATVRHPDSGASGIPEGGLDAAAAMSKAAQLTARVKDYHALENLESAYGYYLDKNLWNDLADLFSADSSMELAQRGIYHGHDRVRGFLLNVFGRGGEGPVEGRLGNHLQWQPVIHVSPDGTSAKIRSRMMQQLNFGERASMGASIYENEAVKEDGRWKFSFVHTMNTWTAAYDGGWMRSPGRFVPGPSADYPPDGPPTLEFQMFPTVYDIPFHYRHPVTGQVVGPQSMHEEDVMNHTSAAPGEPGAMPQDVAEALLAIGARIEPARTGELYAPLHTNASHSGVTVTRNESYGPHERHVLDIFVRDDDSAESSDAGNANEASLPKPVLVFLHGGGFARGTKSQPDAPFYDNVMYWAANEQMVGVNINYRLAPEHMWPSGIEDLTAVVAWLKANIAQHGGDPDRIYLWGHSAGAAHVGDYIANRTVKGVSPGLAGAVLTSGFYELGDEVSTWQVYYGDDVATYPERSSLAGLVASDLPLLVNDAELDPANFQIQAKLLVEARAAVGRPVEYVRLLGHSHISETYAIGTSDTSLSSVVRKFVGRVQHAE
jgi:acetyl esterase/lipase